MAALFTLALAFNPQWITESTIIEVHAWHVAWVLGAALLCVKTIQDLEAPERPFAPSTRMLLWGFVCGVGGAHHATSIFYAACFTAAITWALVRARRFNAAIPLLWLGAGCVPLLGYAWIYWRAAHPGTASIWPTLEPTARGLYDHATGALYRGFLGRWNPDPVQAEALARDIYLWLWPTLLASAVAVAMARTFAERLSRGALLAAASLHVAFTYGYGVVDPVAYFLPPLALSLSLTASLIHGPAVKPGTRHALRPPGVAVIVVLATLLAVCGTKAGLERRHDVEHYDANIRDMWHAVPYERCIFLWPSDVYYKLKLYQQLEGDRPGVEVYNTGMLCNEYPAAQFALRHGFNPLANNGPEHATDVIDPRYLAGRHAAWDPRFLGRVNETIADSARVPVLLFDSEHMRLRQLSHGRAAR